MMNIANQKIGDLLFSKLGVHFIVYGDINEVTGYATNKEELNNIKTIYQELVYKLEEIDGITVSYENFLQTRHIYSGEHLFDENAFSLYYFDIPIIFEDRVEHLMGISQSTNHNRHYHSLLNKLSFIDTADFYISSIFPTLVGVQNEEISDVTLKFASIPNGRSFTKEEIECGKYVAIVNENTYLFENGILRKAMVGDILPITVTVNDCNETFYFEIIGLNDAEPYGGIKTLSSQTYETSGGYQMINNTYHNYIYIPQSCFLEIQEKMLELSTQEGVPLTKEVGNWFLEEDIVFYSQYGGIRPMVITIKSYDTISEVSDCLDDAILKLNRISKRNTDYTYFSNLDRFITILTGSSIQNNMFSLLSVVAISICLFVFIAFISMDIEQNKKEIGIHIALGMNKKRIMCLKFLEYLILCIIPLIISIFFSYSLFQRYLRNINNNILDIGVGEMIFDGYINAIQFSFPVSFILYFIVTVLVCLSISCLFGYYKIRKLNIKNILLQGDIT